MEEPPRRRQSGVPGSCRPRPRAPAAGVTAGCVQCPAGDAAARPVLLRSAAPLEQRFSPRRLLPPSPGTPLSPGALLPPGLAAEQACSGATWPGCSSNLTLLLKGQFAMSEQLFFLSRILAAHLMTAGCKL